MRIVDVKVTVVELSGTGACWRSSPWTTRAPALHPPPAPGAGGAPRAVPAGADGRGDRGGLHRLFAGDAAGAPGAAEGAGDRGRPLRREELYQKLHHGTRWVYQTPGWFGNFDNCLWDIAGKVAGLPGPACWGRVRDRSGLPHGRRRRRDRGALPQALFERVHREWGIGAYKFHSYQGAGAHSPLGACAGRPWRTWC